MASESETDAEVEVGAEVDVDEEDLDLGDDDENSAALPTPSNSTKFTGSPDIAIALNLRPFRNKCQNQSRCGLEDHAAYAQEDFQRCELLALNPKTAVDVLRERFPSNWDAVPPTGLREWLNFPISKKIPYLHLQGLSTAQTGFLYSRGLIGQSLLRNAEGAENFDAGVGAGSSPGEYNALHDPHAKSYFQRKPVKSLLLKHGLISKYGDVVCSIRELNQFRAYLLNVNSLQVNQLIRDKEVWDAYQNAMIKDLTGGPKPDYEGYNIRENFSSSDKQRLKILQLDMEMTRRMREEERYQVAQSRRQLFKEKREIDQIIRLEKSTERNYQIRKKRAKVEKEDMERRRSILREFTKKDILAHLRIQWAALGKRYHREYDLMWLEEKVKASEQRALNGSAARVEKLTNEMYNKALKRQDNVERKRELLPIWLKKRREENARIWKLVRKYFDIWLKKTRAAMKEREKSEDPQHRSHFGKPNFLQEIKLEMSVYQQTPRDFGEFIMSLVKIRRSVMFELPKGSEISLIGAIASLKASKRSYRQSVRELNPKKEDKDDVEEEAPSLLEAPSATA